MPGKKAKTKINLVLYLAAFYVFIDIATPFNRYAIWDTLHITRLVALTILLLLFTSRSIKLDLDKIGKYLIAFYIVMLISYFLSSYKSYNELERWLSGYWKQLLVFWFVYWSINSEKEIHKFLTFLFVSVGLYQLLSWMDFVAGGSYVYQQGLKRMVGTWSGGGLGAANAWGVTGLMMFPIGMYLVQTELNKKNKLMILFFTILSMASVFASGTRGAVICLVIFLGLYFFKKVFNIKTIIIFLVFAFSLHVYLPEDLKTRYLSVIYEDKVSEVAQSRIAESSAESRMQGMIDGWNLFKMRPVFGWGPGSSAYARLKVNDEMLDKWRSEGRFLQLHNLYGQIISETGLLGATLFILILIYCLKLYRVAYVSTLDIEDEKNDTYKINHWIKCLSILMFSYLIYGYATHSLYGMQWILLFGLSASLGKIYPVVKKNRRYRAVNA